MPLEVNDSGTWKEAQEVHVNDGGTWKEAQEVHVNDGGTWKQVHAAVDPVNLTSFNVVEDSFQQNTFNYSADWSDGKSPYTFEITNSLNNIVVQQSGLTSNSISGSFTDFSGSTSYTGTIIDDNNNTDSQTDINFNS